MSGEVGRPRIEINWEELDKLCFLQCTLREIAGFFDCSEDTIDRRLKEQYGVGFAEYFAVKSQGGKISLRRLQYQTATKGNVSMLIWLGKQWLGQTDKAEIQEIKTIQINIDQDDSKL